MYQKYSIAMMLTFLWVYPLGAANLPEESFQAYRNAIYPEDNTIGRIQFFLNDENDDVLKKIVNDLLKGYLGSNYLDSRTKAMTLANYSELRKRMPSVTVIRVGTWMEQGSVASIRLRLLNNTGSQIIELLFDKERTSLIALSLEVMA